MYNENVLRTLPCYHCIHCIDARDMKRGAFTKRKCALTNRWGSMNKSFNCENFQNRQTESSSYNVNGYLIRKDQIEDYRTANQWADAGFHVKAGAVGVKMYASRVAAMNNGKLFMYYLPDQVDPISHSSECCANCTIRQARYCVVAGGYVSMTHHCSEWLG